MNIFVSYVDIYIYLVSFTNKENSVTHCICFIRSFQTEVNRTTYTKDGL